MKNRVNWRHSRLKNVRGDGSVGHNASCPPEGDDGGQRQVVMNFILFLKGTVCANHPFTSSGEEGIY